MKEGARYGKGRAVRAQGVYGGRGQKQASPSLHHGTVSGTVEGETMVRPAVCSMFYKHLSEKEEKRERRKRKEKDSEFIAFTDFCNGNTPQWPISRCPHAITKCGIE